MCKIIKTVITIPCYFCAFYQLIITRYRYIIVLTNQTTPKQKHLGNPIDFTLPTKSAIMAVGRKTVPTKKAVMIMEVMEMTEKEQIQKNVEEFSRLQDYMVDSDKESAAYKKMKKRYIELKVILTTFGVNLTELDYIKE